LWTRQGKVAPASSVLSVSASDDGNTLFAVQNAKVTRYPWYRAQAGSTGPYFDKDMKEVAVTNEIAGDATSLVVDGSDNIFIYMNGGSYDGWRSQDLKLFVSKLLPVGDLKLLVTNDGTLIGYDTSHVYDLSPKTESLTPAALATKTIYSADTVTVKAGAEACGLPEGCQVILKGHRIELPNLFKWPLGATLHVRSMTAN
jgi:hypothetical protein